VQTEPLGYALTFLTDTFVIASLTAVIAYLYSGLLLWSLTPLLFVSITRFYLHQRIKHILEANQAGSFWLIPLRDVLSFAIRVISFTGNSIQWRNNNFNVDPSGLIHIEQAEHSPVVEEDIPNLATNQEY